MSGYAIFFDYDNTTYRLPVNPEQIEISTVQANEKYEILKLGQIVIPTHMELREYSFETELPKEVLHYVETPNNFKEASYYLNLFRQWRVEKKPIRFIASNNGDYEINILVLIEDLNVTEKAGEEGDKYVSFKLLEYKKFGKKSPVVINDTATVKNEITTVATNPKSTGSYIVEKGDCLWNIAKVYYGNGSKYTKIYNANKDIIKNPSLIYPGQRLVIPE